MHADNREGNCVFFGRFLKGIGQAFVIIEFDSTSISFDAVSDFIIMQIDTYYAN